MKKLLYILAPFLLILIGCTDPNPSQPGTEKDAELEYEVLLETEHNFHVDSITEVVIRDRKELNDFLIERANVSNSVNFSDLADFNFQDYILIGILTSVDLGKVKIKIDNIEIEDGKLNVKYSVNETIFENRVNRGSLVFVKVKVKKNLQVRFRNKRNIDNRLDKLTEFTSIAKNIPVKDNNSWKTVIRDELELAKWLSERNFSGTMPHNFIDFEKEMLITVGLPVLRSGKYRLEISDIKLENMQLNVFTELEIIDQNSNGLSFVNHFVKVKKSDIPVKFKPIEIIQNYKIGSELYYDITLLSTHKNDIEEGEAIHFQNKEKYIEHLQRLDVKENMIPVVDFEIFDIIIVKFPEIKGIKFDVRVKKFRLEKSGIRLDVLLEHQKQGAHMRQAPVLLMRMFKSPFDITEFEYEVKEK